MAFYADDWLTIHVGDARAVLATLPAESVHCVVTSPPYYGLRDYGTASWDGGDAECDHLVGPPASNKNTLNGGKGWTPTEYGVPFIGDCGRCGATRQDAQLGLEPTPDAYIANLVAVFREVRRVLRKDGTVWLNLGDSYYSTTATQGRNESRSDHAFNDGSHGINGRSPALDTQVSTSFRRNVSGLKPKDRMMIPARVAIALQADGWWLRDEIVWAKPNPMPSSVTDRTTPAHEMVYLLTRSARYAYDADAVREPQSDQGADRYSRSFEGLTGYHGSNSDPKGGGFRGVGGLRGFDVTTSAVGRNKRSVWTVATQPYPEAHFATFPEALVEPMILAGCPKGGVVLDCFGGSGTVGLVAERLGRRSVLIDLSAEYAAQMVVRIAEGRARGDGPPVDMPVPPADDGLWALAV